jgi:hypothetical protein
MTQAALTLLHRNRRGAVGELLAARTGVSLTIRNYSREYR